MASGWSGSPAGARAAPSQTSPASISRIAEVGAGGLRDEVVAKVDELELAFGLADEEIVGNGGSPRSAAAAPSGGTLAAAPVTTPTPTANDPYAKCNKIKQKRKRRNCLKKVRASLGR